MKKRKFFLGGILAAVLCLLLAVPVLALENGAMGSVRIYMKDAVKGTPLAGGEFECFEVAEALEESGEKVWRYTDAFRNCGASLSDVDKASFVKALARHAENEGLSGEKASADEEGCLCFSVLPERLYLVTQNVATVGYYPTEPFLIRTPSEGVDMEGYQIHAIPKVMAEQSSKVPEGTTVSKTDRLPQTGQLWWPVPVLTLAGLLAIAAGLSGNRKGKGK